MPFQASALRPNPPQRGPIFTILDAALSAVDPYRSVLNALRCDEQQLILGHDPEIRQYDLRQYERIFVIGAGKAATPMVQAIETLLGDRIDRGLVVTKIDHGGPTQLVTIVEASHPVPDELGADAGKQILMLAEGATENDLVITLISGGGSALLVAPALGLMLDDLQQMTDALLACGATINEMNTLRKHCSAVKGGQLARAAAPAEQITLVLSDVVGNPLDVIASGPTVPDTTTWQDSWNLVEKYDLLEKLPMAILGRIQAGLHGKVPDTPTADDPAFARCHTLIVGDNRIAATAARTKAEEVGFNTLLLTTFLEGEAQEVAHFVVSLAKEILETEQPVTRPACLILGGETTVKLGDDPGLGGRNQELALAAAIALDKLNSIERIDASEQVIVVSLATDGTDGPTDSAGGIVDTTTVQRGRDKGLNAEHYLMLHDAYPYLDATNDLLVTGPTQTNVNDLIFLFVI